MSALRTEDRALYVEAMAVAICNAIRKHHGLPPLRNLNDVESPDQYRAQANAALTAYLAKRLGH